MSAAISSARPRPRLRIVPALLSLVCPGLGDFAKGRRRRAYWFTGCFFVAQLSLFIPPAGLALLGIAIVLVFAGLLTWPASIVSALQRSGGDAPAPRWYGMAAYFGAVWVSLGLVDAMPVDRWGMNTAAGGSLMPTILVGEDFAVWKDYFASREPQRGDVVAIDGVGEHNVRYIKRIVGAPGDQVQMVNGRLILNGTPVRRELITEHNAGSSRYFEYEETLPGGARYRIIEISDEGMLDNTSPVRVPAGHYFVLGDNRDNSLDSRVIANKAFMPKGVVPRDAIRDKPTIIGFSSDWSRIGTSVQPEREK
jgi:signal peptidase I